MLPSSTRDAKKISRPLYTGADADDATRKHLPCLKCRVASRVSCRSSCSVEEAWAELLSIGERIIASPPQNGRTRLYDARPARLHLRPLYAHRSVCRSQTETSSSDDPSSHPVGPLFALLTLSPFFLFSSYASIILINRPLSGFNLLLGQLGNEALNGVLKRRWKGVRPGALGDGYGMPSSHSQVSHVVRFWN